MNNEFLDRILTCSDCHAEFIFTAGEQLFFFDKQFKNDPKRCKPCKSRRSGLAAVANGLGPIAAGLSRTETRTECSDCGVETTVPFKPTQGRPVLCRSCFQMKNRAAKPSEIAVAAQLAAGTLEPLTRAETLSTLNGMTTDPLGLGLTGDAAVMAAASMAAASAESSVATAADLALVASLAETEPKHPAELAEIPAAVVAAAEVPAAELVAASVDADA